MNDTFSTILIISVPIVIFASIIGSIVYYEDYYRPNELRYRGRLDAIP